MPVPVFAITLTVLLGAGAAGRQCNKGVECPRAKYQQVEYSEEKGSGTVLAFAIGTDRLLFVTQELPKKVRWEGRDGRVVAIDPEHRVWVFSFGVPTELALEFKALLEEPAAVMQGSYVHSHAQLGESGENFEITRSHLVLSVGKLCAKVQRPLHSSEVGAVFYTKDGKFAGIGALRKGQPVLLLPSGLQELLMQGQE